MRICPSLKRPGCSRISHSNTVLPPARGRYALNFVSSRKIKPGFVEPMLLLRSETLPEGAEWQYELKLDGYRALAIKTSGKVRLRSRNDNDFNSRYPGIVNALAPLPDDTVIDGEVVALD